MAPPQAILEADAEDWLVLLGRLHVLVVHFPVALLWTAGAAELLRAVRRREERSPTARACLALGALSAVVAGAVGWLHADLEPLGESVEGTLFLHRWGGVVTTALALVAFLLSFEGGPGGRRGYRLALLLAVGSVTATGHLGGTLVFGEGFLLDPLRGGAEREAGAAARSGSPTAEPVSYAAEIAPLFAEHCTRCHGTRRRKGGLRLDDLTSHFQRDREDWVIRPGEAEASELVRRIALPPDHEDSMPAVGDPLTDAQVELVSRWIDQGASLE